MTTINENIISTQKSNYQKHMENSLKTVKVILEKQIPFNEFLNIKVHTIDENHVTVKLNSRPELVGNFTRGILHGGVISTVLDVVGGFQTFIALLKRNIDLPIEEKVKRFSRLSTIDLRVDYLRPGLGNFFIGTAYILRFGSRVAVTRMELHNDEDQLIAVGTASYTVS